MSSSTQIGGWVRADEYARFMKYLGQFHLRPAAVATLLIVRELRHCRLPHLKGDYSHPAGADRERITAGPVDGRLKQEFEAHVQRLGLGPDPAAAIIYRAELDEKWLERALELESS